MPILGILASQISGHLALPSSYESIATQTVGSGGTASVTFSSIPTTYTHLQIRGIVRSTASGNSGLIFAKFNGDTGSNYTFHMLQANGSTISGEGYGTSVINGASVSVSPAGLSPSSVLGGFVFDILDYQNTNKYTTTRSLSGWDGNGATEQALRYSSGLWTNTSAITSIDISVRGGSNLAQYSSFALYGIKG